jgi:hypothetical protein
MSFASGYTFQSEEAKKNFEVKFGNVSMYVDGLNISDPVFHYSDVSGFKSSLLLKIQMQYTQ